jgi:hypothetical protein
MDGVFDPRFYRRHNKLSPLWRRGLASAHYHWLGRRRRYQPSPLFDPSWFSRRVLDEGLGAIRDGRELDAYVTRQDLWRTDPHPLAFFQFESFASADPTMNPLQMARQMPAVEAPLGIGHPLVDLREWVTSGPDPSIDGRASIEAAMKSIAEHVSRALRQGHDLACPVAQDVLFINGEAHCPACTQYRVWAPARALEAAGLRVGIVDARDLGRLEGVAPRAKVIVVFRARMTHTLRRFLTRARHLGARIGFDSDDLIFGAPLQVGLQADSYGYREVQGSNGHAADMNEVIHASDFAIVPTETLGAALGDMGVSEADVFVAPSFLSPQQFTVATPTEPAVAMPVRDPNLSAASGTWTHHEDFASALPGVRSALSARPGLRLTTLGAVMPDAFPDLDHVSSQIEHDDRVLRDWASYVQRYERFRANLAPLDLNNGFCQAKSEVKYMEAALAGTPSVASATESYTRALSRGGGILVRSNHEWQEALVRLHDDRETAAGMGQLARADVEERYGPGGTYAKRYLEVIQRQLGGPAAVGERQWLPPNRRPELPEGAHGWLKGDAQGNAFLFEGDRVQQLDAWKRRLPLDGPAPRAARPPLLSTPRATQEWMDAGDPADPADPVVCGPELAAVVARGHAKPLAAVPWVDPLIFYRRMSEAHRGLSVIDAGRLGMPDAPIELADRFDMAMALAAARGNDVLALTRTPRALVNQDILIWIWPGSAVELASLLRQATEAIRIDPLWWDAATTAIDIVVGPASSVPLLDL